MGRGGFGNRTQEGVQRRRLGVGEVREGGCDWGRRHRRPSWGRRAPVGPQLPRPVVGGSGRRPPPPSWPLALEAPERCAGAQVTRMGGRSCANPPPTCASVLGREPRDFKNTCAARPPKPLKAIPGARTLHLRVLDALKGVSRLCCVL